MQFLKKNFNWSGRPEKTPKWPKNEFFGVLTKNLIYTYVLEYESSNDLLTFCKNHVSGSGVVVQKPQNKSDWKII